MACCRTETVRAMTDDPAWKRNNRVGPFDWWLGCQEHGADLTAEDRCLSCAAAAMHNRKLQLKLELEADALPRSGEG